MADAKARLVQLKDENDLPIVPRVASQGVVMSDGTTLETYIDNHHGEASKLAHSLTIGDKVFDGTEDVVIDVYDGSMDNPNLRTMQLVDDSTPMTYSMQQTNIEQGNMTLIAEDTKTLQMNNSLTTNLQMN